MLEKVQHIPDRWAAEGIVRCQGVEETRKRRYCEGQPLQIAVKLKPVIASEEVAFG